MNKIFLSFGIVLITGIMACNNAGKDKDSSKALKAKADSLYTQLLNEHEEGMKGWMKIEGRQKQIKTLLDSIAPLISKSRSSAGIYTVKLNEVSEELKKAYQEMDDWMTEMNLDSAANNVELRIEYLTGEKMKGSKITELINNSLQKADSLLKAKF